MDQVTARITAVLTEKFDVPAELVTARASFQELDLDSLSVVELYVTLQEEWGVPLDAEAATGEVTVGELADEVRKSLEGRRPDDD
ncbi:acyl carrier protein [Kitasatospora fiedleri]|uniref:acyl carrier protein n=1 Tax=Kitasatospora fiedleri TaxID=2991545 RepID=UPI000C2C50A5|nr:phosphopantetheine-binding protein [Kitasatospora fiedleri]